MDELIPLRLGALGRLPPTVTAPRYPREALSAGQLHIGLGNFHRAHLAWYTHSLMQTGAALDWGIIGAGVRPGDKAMRERLLSQDCLSTLIGLDPAGKTAEVTGAMVDFLPVQSDNAALIKRMAAPDIRIVSLTVTEGGYFRDPITGALDEDHPDIRFDAANPRTPCTAFGAMVEALRQRRASGVVPFTGLCCDNLQGNGTILRQTVVGLARLSDPGLADWIDATSSFPDSMVDCIVPATGAREIALAREFCIEDAAPVTHETFRQWVLEDEFCAGRPDWDRVGAVFARDVHPYEAMKIRVLNGGHQIICGAGELLGLDTVSAAMAHEGIRALFRVIALREIAPHVAPVPEFSVSAYVDLIEKRFANPEIFDTTRRVAFDGSSRHAGFILPSIRDGLTKGTSVDGLALVSALWSIYCTGRRSDGREIAPNDPLWPSLTTAANAALSRSEAWLEDVHIYGELRNAPRFANAFVNWHHALLSDGVEPTLKQYLARQS